MPEENKTRVVHPFTYPFAILKYHLIDKPIYALKRWAYEQNTVAPVGLPVNTAPASEHSLPLVIPAEIPRAAAIQKKHPIEQALAELGVSVHVAGVLSGPVLDVVTIEPAKGVRGAVIEGLASDVARLIGAESIRVSQKSQRIGCLDLEISRNKNTRAVIQFSEILKSKQWVNTTAKLPIVMGVDVVGNPVISDFATFPHCLVGGTTGGGKTVFVKTVLCSLISKLSREQFQFVIIDGKGTGFLPFYKSKNFLKVIDEIDDRLIEEINSWADEMNARYSKCKELGVEDITEYQKLGRKDMPRILIVIDEYSEIIDCLGEDKKSLEAFKTAINRIGQKARAVGIHLCVGTQYPTVDVIKGKTRGNLSTRIAFRCANYDGSKATINQGGAEYLLGHGDMLYLENGGSVPQRIHGAFIGNEDIKKLLG